MCPVQGKSPDLSWAVFFLVWKINCFWFDSHYQVGNILPSSITSELNPKILFSKKALIVFKNNSEQHNAKKCLWPSIVYLSAKRNLITFLFIKFPSHLFCESCRNNNFMTCCCSCNSSSAFVLVFYTHLVCSPVQLLSYIRFVF